MALPKTDPTVRNTPLRDTMSVADRDSFDQLYQSHAHTVYVTALAILKNVDTAQDVVHDVFLRAWEQAARYDSSRGSMGIWLKAVAKNLAIDRLRAVQRLVAREGILSQAGAPSHEFLLQLVADEALESVHRAFGMLPLTHRQLIEMAYDKEMSQREIAIHLGQPLGTVKSRIRQALAMLRTFTKQLKSDSASAQTSWLEPVSQALTTAEAEPTALENHIGQLPSLNVLVVDDDDETVRLVSAVLRKFGLHPDTRTSAREGFAALHDSWPDVMIFDLNMPGEDGYSLLGKARALACENGCRLRAAAFTSWGSEHERSRALIAGFDVFINKPVHPLALVSAVARLSR
ncbi:MAG TPA: sigma-70 family RNA polymerase sigma factor [Steroidobacteraceae bacterium]|nr:sigma-70 family RNA polymerase sigma factor [Steroidobacteraceae bacterium]